MANLTLQLADAVKAAGVRSVYGDPIELDGVTLVPVALVQFGFGGGDGGDGGDGNDVPSGGGGGSTNIPIGAYVRDRNGVHFEPNLISLLAVGIPFIWVAGKALNRIIRALKK